MAFIGDLAGYRGCSIVLFFYWLISPSLLASEDDLWPKVLTFSNLSTPVSIRRLGSPSESVYITDSGVKVSLAPQLLVKADKHIVIDNIKSLLSNVSKAQIIAQLSTTTIYLLYLKDTNLHSAMRVLEGMEGVHYVQPNLRQSRVRASLPVLDALSELPSFRLQTTASLNQFDWYSKKASNKPRIAIIDDGFNFSHPEFSEIDIVFSYDADQKNLAVKPKEELDQHGTLIAGLLFAKRDGQGVEGIVPQASVIPIRQVNTWTSDIVLSFYVAKLMEADIINCSWTLAFLPEPIKDVIYDIVTDPKNPAQIVVAAGNENKDACLNNALTTIESIVAVGAAAEGKRAAYSNYGECVDFYAPARFYSTSSDGKGLRVFQGTSAAAAFASGYLAQEIIQRHKNSYGEK